MNNRKQPAEGDGAVARFTPSDADRHRCDNCGLRITDHVPDEEGACCKREAVRQLREILRPAATAVVPDLIADWEVLIEHPDTSAIMRATLRHVVERLKAAAPAAPKGGVVEGALVERVCSAAYIDWSNCSESNKHDCRNIIRAALATGEQP